MPGDLWTCIQWCAYIGACQFALLFDFWDIHVSELECVPLLENVCWFNVSVNDVVRVKVVKGLGHIADDFPDEFLLDLFLFQPGTEDEV